jgi:hypothetical protein
MECARPRLVSIPTVDTSVSMRRRTVSGLPSPSAQKHVCTKASKDCDRLLLNPFAIYDRAIVQVRSYLLFLSRKTDPEAIYSFAERCGNGRDSGQATSD